MQNICYESSAIKAAGLFKHYGIYHELIYIILCFFYLFRQRLSVSLAN